MYIHVYYTGRGGHLVWSGWAGCEISWELQLPHEEQVAGTMAHALQNVLVGLLWLDDYMRIAFIHDNYTCYIHVHTYIHNNAQL